MMRIHAAFLLFFAMSWLNMYSQEALSDSTGQISWNADGMGIYFSTIGVTEFTDIPSLLKVAQEDENFHTAYKEAELLIDPIKHISPLIGITATWNHNTVDATIHAHLRTFIGFQSFEYNLYSLDSLTRNDTLYTDIYQYRHSKKLKAIQLRYTIDKYFGSKCFYIGFGSMFGFTSRNSISLYTNNSKSWKENNTTKHDDSSKYPTSTSESTAAGTVIMSLSIPYGFEIPLLPKFKLNMNSELRYVFERNAGSRSTNSAEWLNIGIGLRYSPGTKER